METKEQLVNTIRKWIKIDNEIRALQKESNKRRADKKKISNDLIDVMKKNEIDCFDINDGQLLYSKKNVRKPITQKVLLDILSNYYQGDTLKASEVNNFIMENRESTTRETIVRKIFKDDIDGSDSD
jgi:hypothetical protein